MLTDILNRSWKVSPEQASVLVKDVLSRRKVLYQGAMVSAGLMLAACAGIDFSTIGPAVAGDLADIAAALSTGLGALGSLSGQLPAGWAATLQQITTWVTDLQAIASGLSSTSLVSTAGGSISNFIHDFNAIVEAIISNPVVSALVSGTGFGWALSAASVLLPIAEQVAKILINIVMPPAPTPVSTAQAAHPRMAMRLAEPINNPDTARLILKAIIAGKMGAAAARA